MAIEISVIGLGGLVVVAPHSVGVRGHFDMMTCECVCGWNASYRLTGDPERDTDNLNRMVDDHSRLPLTVIGVEAVAFLAAMSWSCLLVELVVKDELDLMAWCERELISEVLRADLLAFVAKLGQHLNG